MSGATFQSQRGIYVQGAPLEYVQARLLAYPEFLGERQRYTVALSEMRSGWVLIAVPDDLVQGDFYNMALWLLGGDELEEDLEEEDGAAAGIELPPDAVLAVSYAPGQPEQCYYAQYNEADDPEFVGRRDDGKGLRVDVIEDEVKVLKSSKRFSLSVLDYLKERGVPQELWPGPRGFAPPKARQVAIETNL